MSYKLGNSRIFIWHVKSDKDRHIALYKLPDGSWTNRNQEYIEKLRKLNSKYDCDEHLVFDSIVVRTTPKEVLLEQFIKWVKESIKNKSGELIFSDKNIELVEPDKIDFLKEGIQRVEFNAL